MCIQLLGSGLAWTAPNITVSLKRQGTQWLREWVLESDRLVQTQELWSLGLHDCNTAPSSCREDQLTRHGQSRKSCSTPGTGKAGRTTAHLAWVKQKATAHLAQVSTSSALAVTGVSILSKYQWCSSGKKRKKAPLTLLYASSSLGCLLLRSSCHDPGSPSFLSDLDLLKQ